MGDFLNVRRDQGERREILGILGKHLLAEFEHLGRLVQLVVKLKLLVLKVSLRVFFNPLIQVLKLLGRIGLFDDIVVEIVFGLILDLFLGLGRRALRIRVVCCPRDENTKGGDDRHAL